MFEELWSSKCSLLLWKKKKKKDVISIIIIYWIFLCCENSSWRSRKTQDAFDLFFIDLNNFLLSQQWRTEGPLLALPGNFYDLDFTDIRNSTY